MYTVVSVTLHRSTALLNLRLQFPKRRIPDSDVQTRLRSAHSGVVNVVVPLQVANGFSSRGPLRFLARCRRGSRTCVLLLELNYNMGTS